MRDVAAAAAGLGLVIEAWAAAYYRDESCGPARRPRRRFYRFCGADEAALCGAAPSFTAADFRRNRRRCRGPSHDGSAWTCRRANSPFPGAGKLSGATQPGWAGGYFLVACVARRGPGALVGTGGLLRGGNGVRRGVRRKPELLCGARIARRDANATLPKSRATAHLCQIGACWLGIHHIPAAEER